MEEKYLYLEQQQTKCLRAIMTIIFYTYMNVLNEKIFKKFQNWKEYVSKNVRNKFLKNPKLYIHDSNFRDHIFDENNYVKHFSKNSIKHSFQEKNCMNR